MDAGPGSVMSLGRSRNGGVVDPSLCSSSWGRCPHPQSSSHRPKAHALGSQGELSRMESFSLELPRG